MISMSANAGINEDLNKFFVGMGFNSNVNKPRAFQDQQGGYYSGGSIIARSKMEEANLFSFSPPNASMGCGSIDLFGGAFSFINKEQFMALMNDIGKKSMAFGISLALQTAAPQIKSVIDQLMGAMQEVNGLNMTSCNLSASLLGGLLPKSDASTATLCQSIGMANNRFSDYAAAKHGCSDRNTSSDVNRGKPHEFDDVLGEEFNLAWKALNKSALFSSDRKLAELFLSISGSVIMRNHGKTRSPEYLFTLADDNLIAALIEGGKTNVYHCDTTEPNGCLNPTPIEINILESEAFLHKVEEYITSLERKVKLDEAISEEERSFVNSTYFPILKIIAVETAFKEGNAPITAHELARIITYDIVLRYLNRAVDLTSYAVAKLQAVQIDDTPFKDFIDGTYKVKQIIYQKRQGLFHQLNTTIAVIERTQQIEKQLHDLFMQGEMQ